MGVVIKTEINSCQECHKWQEGPPQSTDGWDRGCDWICLEANKKIAGFVEWHDHQAIPDWCPFREENNNLDK